MSNNIFRVIKSLDLDEILQDHNESIVVVMFSSKTCGPCIAVKPKFCAIATEHKDCFFVYVDMHNFEDSQRKYLALINATPKFLFYFGSSIVAEVLGPNEKAITNTLVTIKSRLAANRVEIEKQAEYLKYRQHNTSQIQQAQHVPKNTDAPVIAQRTVPDQMPRPQSDQTVERKLEIMKALYQLSQMGAPVSKKFTLEDKLEEMVAEYHRLMDMKRTNQATPQIEMSQHSQESSPNQVDDEQEKQKQLELIKKEQEIKRIQDLEHLRRLATMQNMKKMKEIKAIKQARQQEEEREKRKEK
jgi:thiol-disulfide isomerase/thioredoxin